MRLLRKKIIYGCETRGDAGSPYLTRFTLIDLFGCAAYLHIFHRSDADEHHDHPWSFASVILWRGYNEETACPECQGTGTFIGSVYPHEFGDQYQEMCGRCFGEGRFKKRVWPGMILFRPATWRHRVELIDGKKAVTLVIRTRYIRQWGFFTKSGWQHWKDYFTERGC